MPTPARTTVVTPGAVANFADPTVRERLSGAAFRGFLAVAERWGLTLDQQLLLLGSPARSTYFEWRKRTPTLSADLLTRISYLLGIFEGLERWLGAAPHEADAWVTRPNADHPFYGRSPLERMLAGGIPMLAIVRAYLDGVAGGPPVSVAE